MNTFASDHATLYLLWGVISLLAIILVLLFLASVHLISRLHRRIFELLSEISRLKRENDSLKQRVSNVRKALDSHIE